MWRKLAIMGAALALSGCVSGQVHRTTVGMTETYEALRNKVVLENLGRAIDDPTGTPVQFVFSQGTSQASASSGFTALRFPHFNLSSKTNEVDLAATGTWTDQWTFIPVSDSADLASLRNLYTVVVDLDAATLWYSKTYKDYPSTPTSQSEKYISSLDSALDDLSAKLAAEKDLQKKAQIEDSMTAIVKLIGSAPVDQDKQPSNEISDYAGVQAVIDACSGETVDSKKNAFCTDDNKSHLFLAPLALSRPSKPESTLPYFDAISIFDAIDNLTWKSQSLDCLKYLRRGIGDTGYSAGGTLQWVFWRKMGEEKWQPHDPPKFDKLNNPQWEKKTLGYARGYEIAVTAKSCYDDFVLNAQRATQNTTTKSGFTSPSPTLVTPSQ
jgi:hypothetical protein